MHEVLVNRLGGLSLPRKSVVRLTDRPDMTLDAYRGRKTTIQYNNNKQINMLLCNCSSEGQKAKQAKAEVDLQASRDLDLAFIFQATIGGKFAPLLCLRADGMYIATMNSTDNSAVRHSEPMRHLGRNVTGKKLWVTGDVPDLYNERRDLMKK